MNASSHAVILKKRSTSVVSSGERNRRRLVAFCVLLVAFFSGCGRESDKKTPIPVRVMTLQSETVAMEMRFSATVREWQRIELSFKVPGTVESLMQRADTDGQMRTVHEGDEVTSDPEKPLARLDISDIRRRLETVQDKLAQARAKQRAAEASVTTVQATFERISALKERGSVSQQMYDETLGKRDSADAQLDASKREVSEAIVALRQAEDDLKNCKLVLPIPKAVVSAKRVEQGERVQAGQPVFQIMDLSRVRAAFGVADSKISHFRLGEELTVTADALPGEVFVGRITKIGPAADLKTRTFEVEVTIDEPKGLKPGMVVTILVGQRRTMTLLPMTSVQRGPEKNGYVVYTVVEEGGRKIARQRRVVLDGVYDNRIRVVEGEGTDIKPGDAIVVSGAFRLTQGQEVRVMDIPEPSLRIE